MRKMFSLAVVSLCLLAGCQRTEAPAPVATSTTPPPVEPVAATTVVMPVDATVVTPSVAAAASELPDVGTQEKLPQMPEDLPPDGERAHSLNETKDTEPGNP